MTWNAKVRHTWRAAWIEWQIRKFQRRVVREGGAAVVSDEAGNRFWRFMDDDMHRYFTRGMLCDSDHVACYIRSVVKPGWICLDIGANVGLLTVPMWKAAGGSGRVWAIEPIPELVRRLKMNLRLNGLCDDFVFQGALADRNGPVAIRQFPDASGWATFGDPLFSRGYSSSLIEVTGVSFSEFLRQRGLDHLDFVKMDVEGAELLVLNDMREVLEKKRVGIVVFEVNALTLEGMKLTVDQLFSFWEAYDYRLYRLNEKGVPELHRGAWPFGVVGDAVAVANP